MRRDIGVISVAVFVLAALFCWEVRRPNYRRVTMPDGTVALAHLNGLFTRTDKFFSVRLRDGVPSEPLNSLARLHLRGHDFLLRDLRANDLRELGVSVSPVAFSCLEPAAIMPGRQW